MTKARTLADNFAADINAITAGTGITGGGTSGTVTVTNEMATEIDAKADLIVGTGADTFSILGVGANGTVLTAASGEATGLEWVAPAGGGKVLQVVSATTTTGASIATSTFTDTNITATITPTLDTSQILILIAANQGVVKSASGVNIQGRSRVMRDATVLFTNFKTPYFEGATASDMVLTGQYSYVFLDSPASTSALVYKLQGMVITGASAEYQDDGNSTSTITLLEIGV